MFIISGLVIVITVVIIIRFFVVDRLVLWTRGRGRQWWHRLRVVVS
jgi:hypothetical protein